MSLHISSITGIVLSAFANPPGPQVSCPITLYFNGNLSSLPLASNPPTLNWVTTKSASFNASFLLKETEIFVSNFALFIILSASFDTIVTFSLPSSISTSVISFTGNSLFLFINPLISSGV